MIHTEEQLDHLSECLLDLPYENDGMILSELDGFIAGLIVCPEMAMPSEWLSVVWGDDFVPNFKDKDPAETTHKAVMEHYNRVAKSLMPPIVEYEAIFGLDPNSDETLWEPWICGFERAMRLKPDSWKAIVEGGDEEARSSVLMILALNDVYCGNSELNQKAIDELDERAPDMIPDMVATLNNWTKGGSRKSASSSREATSNVVPFRTSKVGRNEPCPCGSGRKYKKCCGLN